DRAEAEQPVPVPGQCLGGPELHLREQTARQPHFADPGALGRARPRGPGLGVPLVQLPELRVDDPRARVEVVELLALDAQADGAGAVGAAAVPPQPVGVYQLDRVVIDALAHLSEQRPAELAHTSPVQWLPPQFTGPPRRYSLSEVRLFPDGMIRPGRLEVL